MRDRDGCGPVVRALLALALIAGSAGAAAAAATPGGEDEIRRLVGDYARAIETKDVDLFHTLKPNLSGEEERRLARAFASVRSQRVTITIESIQVQGEGAVVHLSRRDILDGALVSRFPQTLRLSRGPRGWSIEDIGH